MTEDKTIVSTELLPCPFCEGPSHTEANRALPGGVVVVHDGLPHCPVRRGYCALSQWNTRPSQPPVTDVERRKSVAAIVKQAILVNAWSDENCLKWADKIIAAMQSNGEG